MSTLLNQVQIMSKAIKAEQRNGCTNAGVMGGFANFILSTANKLENEQWVIRSGNQAAIRLLQQLAENYLAKPPRQRLNDLEQIRKLTETLLLRIQGDMPAVKDIAEREIKPDEPHKDQAKQPNKTVPPVSNENKQSLPAGLPIQYLKSVGPQRMKLFARLNIYTVQDLLNHFPRQYEDRRDVKNINQLTSGEVQTVRGVVVAHQELKPRRGLKIIKITLHDGTGRLQAVWFNNPYLIKQLPTGTEVIITGKVDRRFGMPELSVNDYEILDDKAFTPRIVPVYGATENLPLKQIRTLMGYALERVNQLMPEVLPQNLLVQHSLMSREEAYRQIHFPDDMGRQREARQRLVFEELVLLQLGIQRMGTRKNEQVGTAMACADTLVADFRRSLPFELTLAQERVVSEIYADMAKSCPMARLVQGDVGSGKTVVAAMALLKAVECGYQGAMMAPTEILASQHFSYLQRSVAPFGVRVDRLVGSMGKREREEVLARVADGSCDILVGTHALIQDSVVFKSLGLAVADEQHRFGVRQRAGLQQKGRNPHVLVMTATPIPRTLALTVYGDLHLSVIDQLPPGRKEIKTVHITEKSRSRLYSFMEREIKAGRQVYVVCPLVEESEVLDLKAASELAKHLADYFPQFKVSLLHGRMKSADKEEIIQQFCANLTKILVSTTVIEVGVNVPNASVMVVEGAERFGLAQLHQLRGRVGRGEYQSYCMLVSDARSDEVKRRLAVMCESNDGFRIAEEDLQIRGPGEFFGTRQHGLPELKIADIIRDGAVLEQARQAAEVILTEGPPPCLWQEVERKFGSNWVQS